MYNPLEFIGLFFEILSGFLVAGFALWALPSVFAIAQSEKEPTPVLAQKPSKARHRRAAGVVDEWMQNRVTEFRNKAKTVANHHRDFTASEIFPLAVSFVSSLTLRDDRQLKYSAA
jgi:hypothetical protein